LWQRHLASRDLQEREDLIKQAQKIVLDEYMFVPIYINSFTLGVGPRIAGNPDDYIRTPMVVLPGPAEDFKLQTKP
jgi:ABC-type transport system substrate-binding protein